MDAVDHLDLAVTELVHRPAERDLARRIAELEARLAALERPCAA
jgi:hypothetical protein